MVLAISGMITSSVLLAKNVSYDEYECKNVTITSVTVACFSYSCQYQVNDKNITFDKVCCNDISINCDRIYQNIVNTKIYIFNQITYIILFVILSVSIFTIIITPIIPSMMFYRNKDKIYALLSTTDTIN